MRIRKRSKPKYRAPTVDEFLEFTPKRLEFEWDTNEEGLVIIKVPKFGSNFGKSFLKLTKKEGSFDAKMDKIGSIVWKNSDGKNTVKDILDILKKEFPNEKEIDQRLFLFLQQMQSLQYLIL